MTQCNSVLYLVRGLGRACIGGQHCTCRTGLQKECLWRTAGPAHHAVPLGKPNCPSPDQVVSPIRLGEVTGVTSLVPRTSISYMTSNVNPSTITSSWVSNRDQSRQWLHVSCSPAYGCQPGSLRLPPIVSPNVTFHPSQSSELGPAPRSPSHMVRS